MQALHPSSVDRGLAQHSHPKAHRPVTPELVDLNRACRILGVGEFVIRQLAATPREAGGFLLEVAERNPRGRYRILYASIVRLCEDLRRTYSIRPRSSATVDPHCCRHDDDLLPFPLSDTIDLKETRQILGYATNRPVIQLIEEGWFEAYKLVDNHGSPWRISRKSLAAFFVVFLASNRFSKPRGPRPRGL